MSLAELWSGAERSLRSDTSRLNRDDLTPEHLMGRRALIVDADLPALSATAGWLKEAGFDTVAVTTFAEGRTALDRFPFDVLVADVRLGAFNGIHLVLLARHRTPSIRAVVTYADPSPSLDIEARRAGADDFLTKPLSRDSLMMAVGPSIQPVESTFSRPRRWPRVRLSQFCEGRIADADARVLDVSYGGVRVEAPDLARDDVGSLLRLDLSQPPLSIHVRPIWLHEAAPGYCWYGAEIADPDPAAAGRWRSFVDSVSPS